MKNQRGFTLIEVAIATLVLGLFIVMFMTFYDRFVVKSKIDVTNARLSQAYLEIQNFANNRGRYPCPASLSAPYGSLDYGLETNCADLSVVAGACEGSDAFCVRESLRTDLTSDQRRVRVGAIPFREVALREHETYDGYGTRLFYAVSESLANTNTYNNANGGIQIIDENGTDLSTPASSVKFIVFTVGIDGKGGYTMTGARSSDCSSDTSDERLNCDFSLPAATFFSSAMSHGSTHNDDKIEFINNVVDTENAGWRKGVADQGENPDDIIVSNRNIMIGDFDRDPVDVVEIFSANTNRGDVLSQTNIELNQICDNNTGNCFNITDLEHTCPAGEYITGIGSGSGKRIICRSIYFGCETEDEMIVGKNADGTAKCKIITTAFSGMNDNDVSIATDGNGGTIGSIVDGGSIIDGAGNVIGSIAAGSTVLGTDGTIIGSTNADGNVISNDGTGTVIGSIGSGGQIYDGNGNVIGTVASGSNVVDGEGNIVGNTGNLGNGDGNSGNSGHSAYGSSQIGEGGVIHAGNNGNGQVVGYIAPGSQVVGPNGDVLGTVGENGSVIDGNGTIVGNVGAGGQVIGSSGNSIGTVGVGSSILDANGNIIGSVGSTGLPGTGDGLEGYEGEVISEETEEIQETEQTEECTNETRNQNLTCPNDPTKSYKITETKSCNDDDWIPISSNQRSACCTLAATSTVVNTAPESSPNASICGIYGFGTRTGTRTLNPNTCTYGSYTFTYNCTCFADVASSFTPSCSNSSNEIEACGIANFTHPKSADGRCSTRTNLGNFSDGSCKSATYFYSNAGANIDEMLTQKGTLPEVGESCPSASTKGNCVVQDGSGFRLFRNCSCKKNSGGLSCG